MFSLNPHSVEFVPGSAWKEKTCNPEEIGQIVEAIRHRPQQLEETILSYIKNNDIDTLADILIRLLPERGQLMNTRLCLSLFVLLAGLPADPQRRLLEIHPELFLTPLDSFGCNERDAAVREVIEKFPIDWKSKFIQIFQGLSHKEEKTKPADQPAARFASFLLQAFSKNKRNEWVCFCCESMQYENWAFLMTLMTKSEREIVVIHLTTYLQFDLSAEGYLEVFCALAKFREDDALVIRDLFEKIVQKFRDNRSFYIIRDDFEALSQDAQACLLDVMHDEERKEILLQYHSNVPLMACWLDRLLSFQSECKAKNETASLFLSQLASNTSNFAVNFESFIASLNAKRSPCAVHLLSQMNRRCFDHFVYSMNRATATEFLKYCSFDKAAMEGMCQISSERRWILLNVMSLDFDEFSNELITEPTTFAQCFAQLDACDLSEPEFAGQCQRLVELIPPVLIGLHACDQETRAAIKKYFPLMARDQIKFYICGFQTFESLDLMETYAGQMKRSSLESTLEGMPSAGLRAYLSFRAEKVDEARDVFETEFRALSSEMADVLKNHRVELARFHAMEERVTKMLIAVRKGTNLQLECIRKLYKSIDQNSLLPRSEKEELKSKIRKLNLEADALYALSHHFRKGIGTIDNQMRICEEYLIGKKETELLETLYHGFTVMLTESALRHLEIGPDRKLGISHPNELRDVGILNNEDLARIGITQHAENEIYLAIKDLKSLLIIPEQQVAAEAHSKSGEGIKKKRTEIDSLWEDLRKIGRQDQMSIGSLAKDIVEKLNIPDEIDASLCSRCKSFFSRLLNFPHLSDDEKRSIQEVLGALDQGKIDEVAASLSDLLRRSLIILREQQPVFCLQRYLLDNVEIKTVWGTLRAEGYQSIEDLYVKGFAEHPQDVFQLNMLLNLKAIGLGQL